MKYKDIQETIREYPDGIIDVASNGRIGRYCFFPEKIQKHYEGEIQSKLTILDVACGAAADHPLLYDFFEKKGIELILIGVDVNKKLLQLTKEGQVTYPLEVDLEINTEGKVSIEEGMIAYDYRKDAYLPESLYDTFMKWEKGYQSKRKMLHIDDGVNEVSGRWIMKPEYREKLDLRCEDATQLSFENNFADVVIAENFLFGYNNGVYRRINDEINRVLRPSGIYLGDDRR